MVCSLHRKSYVIKDLNNSLRSEQKQIHARSHHYQAYIAITLTLLKDIAIEFNRVCKLQTLASLLFQLDFSWCVHKGIRAFKAISDFIATMQIFFRMFCVCAFKTLQNHPPTRIIKRVILYIILYLSDFVRAFSISHSLTYSLIHSLNYSLIHTHTNKYIYIYI